MTSCLLDMACFSFVARCYRYPAHPPALHGFTFAALHSGSTSAAPTGGHFQIQHEHHSTRRIRADSIE